MFNEYITKLDGKIVVSNENGNMLEKENHEKIKEELDLENEIEILDDKIEKCEFEKFDIHLTNIASICGLVIGCIMFLILISGSIGSSLIVKIILDFLAISIGGTFSIISIIFIKKMKIESKKVKVSIEYLKQELTKRKEELQELQNSKVKTETVDAEIHKLNTNNYKEQLKNELVELYSYCESLKKGEVFDIEKYNSQRTLKI